MMMERYRNIIPDFEEFIEFARKPKPFEVRVNTIKSSPREVQEFFREERIPFELRGWSEIFFKTDGNPSKTLFHWLGKYYMQESSSGIPPLVLDPKPGERVLDMCAAPGSKTTQIVAMMQNKGELLANDVRQRRTRSLLSNLYRLGCTNVQVTERDGRNLPESPKFDKILVDAPCSSEGTVRDKEEIEEPNLERIKELSNLQRKLLEKAFRMCKRDGVIVYSTCTFAPEENELVVSKFLERAKLVKSDFDFLHSAGITEWNGNDLSEDLGKCARVYPHQIDSGGIFLAKFEKKA